MSEVVVISKVDYVVMNCLEFDHSGALPTIMEYIPNAAVIVSKNGKETIKRHYHKD